MSEPILSICIPTYNRSKYLVRLLDSLVHEIADNSLPVNIKITNNASTDDTKALCDEFAKMYDFLTVVHQLENMGADYNISTAFSMSDGQYTWIIGDDDYIRHAAIISLISLITSTNYPNLIALGSEFTTQNIPGCVTEPLSLDVYSDPCLFANKVGVMFTFISGMVIKRNHDFCHESVLQKFDKSCLIQLSWVLPPLEKNGIFVKVNDVFIIAEPDNTGGYHLFDVFSVKLKFMCDSSLGGDSPITPIILKSSSRFLISLAHKRVNSDFIRELNFSTLDTVFGNIAVYKYCYRFLYKHPLLWQLASVVKRIIKR